jgi:multidrug efflux pump subunit AcrA (membrane-fusion protein)
VRSRSVDRGQYVTLGTEVAQVYAVDWAEVRLPVQNTDLARLELSLDGRGVHARGDELAGTDGTDALESPRVLLTADFAGASRTWEGRIVRSEGVIDPRSRMVVLVARVENPYGRPGSAESWPLLSGMFVEARIEGRKLSTSVVLPRSALHVGGRVFVLDEEERLDIRELEILEAGRDQVVVAGGIFAGERVIVSPIELPVQGMALRASEDAR